ncbi:MAG: glutamate--tRNA ligase [Candidatus Westeberhardia cardiocondylae]|nr:glutamate--tRNA ligase [Candidatus Westeberhardia cardiocondylae]
MNVKTRFSPSPTGFLHLGNIRTALYSWLFAKNKNGKFILRIDDSDCKRVKKEAIENIMESLIWLNLRWDDKPYFQSERFDRYNFILDKMILDGYAYKCYCSRNRLNELRKNQLLKKEKPRYDGYCRYNMNKRKKVVENNSLFVVRFCNPIKGKVVFYDLIRGVIQFNNQELDDFIIKRSDGSLTYNFCSVIDDIDMSITHVFRGEEHINNTPKQINIFHSLNASIPKYVHLSTVFGDNKKKLSKRCHSMQIMQFRDDGFLPEALLNYLIRLGWSHKNQEIFSIEEMIQLFDINCINKSSSILNKKKLLWLNKYYIRTLPAEKVVTYLKWCMDKQNISVKNYPKVVDLVNIFCDRFYTLKDMAINFRYFYQDTEYINSNLIKKYLSKTTKKSLKIVSEKLNCIKKWTKEEISLALNETAKELNVKINEINMPVRVAITSMECSPNISLIIYIIGRKNSVKRINMVLELIQ